MGTGSFTRVKSGRGVKLTPRPLLVPWSRKSRAIPLLPCGPYGLYRVSVPVQRCTLPYLLTSNEGTYRLSQKSVTNYHYSLHNDPEERNYHLLRGGSLKSRTYCPSRCMSVVKQPDREAYHWSPSSTEVENKRSYTSTSPICLHGGDSNNATCKINIICGSPRVDVLRLTLWRRNYFFNFSTPCI